MTEQTNMKFNLMEFNTLESNMKFAKMYSTLNNKLVLLAVYFLGMEFNRIEKSKYSVSSIIGNDCVCYNS